MKRYTTPRKAIGETIKVAGTPYKIVVPFSARSSQGMATFTLGSVSFHVNGYGKNRVAHPMTPLPASWLVDLNAVNGD